MSWGSLRQSSRVVEWLIYASNVEGDKGEYRGRAQPDAYHATIQLEEGTWWVRVLAKFEGGAVQEWERVEPALLPAQPRALPPAGLSLMGGAAPIATGQRGVIVFDPPHMGEIPQNVQIIRTPDATKPWLGRLIADIEIHPGDVMNHRGRAAIPFEISGSEIPHKIGAGSLTSTIIARAVTTFGMPMATHLEFDQVLVDRLDYRAAPIASILDDGTLANFPAPGESDPFETDATEGVQMMLKPISAGDYSAKTWGTSASGMLAESPTFGAYMADGEIESSEVDLTANKFFHLEIYDELHRVDGTDYVGSVPSCLVDLPSSPVDYLRTDDGIGAEQTYGPRWMAREYSSNGTPLHPLRRCYWEVATGTAADGSAGSYVRYVPGMPIMCRYIKVRLTVRDELGGTAQIATGNVKINALYPRRNHGGVFMFPASQTTPQAVTLIRDPITGLGYFPNEMIVMLQVRGTTVYFAQITTAAAGGTSFSAQVYTSEGGTPESNVAVNYIVQGW